MTVLSVGVVNKQGKVILSRQFMEVSRIRIEGLLSAFPRLLDASVNKQATFLDAGTVRYVYQPLEDVFLVLVTSRNSNIVEDLTTLHMVGRLIPEFVPEGISEAALEAKAFPIFFALDEVVVGGKREHTTTEQIHTYLQMESHEETLALEAKRQQMEKAKRVTAEHARMLRERRRDKALGDFGSRGGGAYGGIGSDDQSYGGFGSTTGGHDAVYSIRGQSQMPATLAPTLSPVGTQVKTTAPSLRSGMSLGKARKDDISSKVQKEVGGTASLRAEPVGLPSEPAAPSTVEHEGVHIIAEEKLSAVVGRDGSPGPIDIKGELSVLITDPQLDHVKLLLSPVSNQFTFKAHTKVNKALFASDNVIAMVDNKPLPVQQPVTILRWRLNQGAGVQAPLTFTCWPEMGSLTVEYEIVNASAPPLENVRVAIPLRGVTVEQMTPSIGTCECVNDYLLWAIPVVGAQHNSSGNVEVQLGGAAAPEDTYFPIEVSFHSVVSVGLVHVSSVVGTDNGLPVRFSQETRLLTDCFTVE